MAHLLLKIVTTSNIIEVDISIVYPFENHEMHSFSYYIILDNDLAVTSFLQLPEGFCARALKNHFCALFEELFYFSRGKLFVWNPRHGINGIGIRMLVVILDHILGYH